MASDHFFFTKINKLGLQVMLSFFVLKSSYFFLETEINRKDAKSHRKETLMGSTLRMIIFQGEHGAHKRIIQEFTDPTYGYPQDSRHNSLIQVHSNVFDDSIYKNTKT